jgi:hypothetical protein
MRVEHFEIKRRGTSIPPSGPTLRTEGIKNSRSLHNFSLASAESSPVHIAEKTRETSLHLRETVPSHTHETYRTHRDIPHANLVTAYGCGDKKVADRSSDGHSLNEIGATKINCEDE